MIYIINDGSEVALATKEDKAANVQGLQCRWDWHSYEETVELAKKLSEREGELYIATDAGECCSPQFDIIKAPKVGDEVSKSFNGDTYPVGTVTSISKTMKKITTSTGDTFYRRKMSGTWSDGTFALVRGHIDERNPHF